MCSGGTKTLLNSANISCSGKSSVQFKSEDLPGVTQAFITSRTYIQVTQHLVESCNPFGVKELASSKVTQPSQQISKNNFNGIINSQCPAGTRTQPATQYFFRYPTRFIFRNHRVAGNPKHWVLPDISGKPEVSATTRYSGYHP